MTGETKRALVNPQTLKGFQDFLPEAMILRNQVAQRIKSVYESYGFLPIDTPILEHLASLIGTGGEETNKELFRLESPENEAVAMRYDLTVPLARIVAQYRDTLKLPFRRYHFGPVFRADKPGFGRFRQFTQFDIDVVGTESVAADAEIIAAMCEVMRAVGICSDDEVRDFEIRINNRKLMDALLQGFGLRSMELQKHVLRVIDKLKKVGLDNVRKELGQGRVDESGDPIKGVGLSPDIIEKVLAFISIRGSSRHGVLEEVQKHLSDSEASRTALSEMRTLADCLDALHVRESEALFDPSLARGLDYYTGPIYEAYLLAAPEFGSVIGGGRYDRLVERFLDVAVPGTGASIGFDRFVSALEKLGKLPAQAAVTKALLITLGDVQMTDVLGCAKELRNAGIPTEVYLGEGKAGMKTQLSFANTRRIPIAVILGEDEVKAGKVSIKDLQAGFEQRAEIKDHDAYRKAGKSGQVTVDRSAMVETVKSLLG
ncbi:MAG TPA: histidine--tRNA ligase [bacterium]|nr:histidine--tRNA ligase [bacterium]